MAAAVLSRSVQGGVMGHAVYGRLPPSQCIDVLQRSRRKRKEPRPASLGALRRVAGQLKDARQHMQQCRHPPRCLLAPRA